MNMRHMHTFRGEGKRSLCRDLSTSTLYDDDETHILSQSIKGSTAHDSVVHSRLCDQDSLDFNLTELVNISYLLISTSGL